MKIAVVIPWFGRELKGGAEQHAWQVASRLAGRGHAVEVLTTCCRSHQEDWSTNHLKPGRSTEPEGFSIRRFPVDPRNRAEFDRVCGHLLGLDPASLRPGVSPISPTDSHIFTTELIKSERLLEFIRSKKEKFDAFIFLPYLYGLLLEGIRIVGPAAALQPCLHDEAYAYLPEVAEAFHTAGSLLFISEGEQELAFRLFGPAIWSKSTLTGAGIEPEDAKHDGAAPASTSPGHPEKFLLYLGRKDAGKNVPLLLNAFARFRRVRPNSPLRLILAGHGEVNLNGCGDDAAADLGLVSEREKQKLLQHCTALVQPSQNESFSRVMMEAWFHGKPVAAHSRCLATAVAVERSGGGWVAETESDWARLITEIDRMPAEALSKRGAHGRQYAGEMADWETVMDRYEVALARHKTGRSSTRAASRAKRPAINQFLPNLTYGDAISNQAIWIRNLLRREGFDSDIYVQFIDPRMAHECRLFTPKELHRSDAAIYHHSIGADMTSHLIEFRGPKYLIYHNITPGEFFERYRPEFARILYSGREDLPLLARRFENSAGVSAFNAAELAESGFKNPGLLPLAIDPRKWALQPDPAIMAKMQDGRTNILFVGRFAPNKKQDDLIVAFSHYLHHDPDARLILVGKPEQADPYVTHLRDLITELGLSESVYLPGSVEDAQLAAYYRSANLFWSMSEHEGFCVPLIEAMWFDIPILAFKASAIPETLGDAGLMFSRKDDLAGLAALARILIDDSELREKLIRAQRARRLEFLPDKVLPVVMKMIDNLCPR